MKTREELILNNTGLVHKVINSKFPYTNQEYDDLLSIGTIGLTIAVDNFDENRGVKFSTFAYKCIQVEIIKYLEEKQHKIVALSLDTNPSLNKNGDNDSNLINIIDDKTINIEQDYIEKEEKIIINKLLYKVELSDRNRFIILLYYGFYNGRKYERKDLAKIFNTTEQNISLIINKFLKQIDKLIKKEYGKEILDNRNKYKLYYRTKNK